MRYLVFVVMTAGLAVATPTAEGTKSVTWTGWFSDAQCARVIEGEVKPNNTECVKRCLTDGAKAVFASEQAKAIFEVKDHPSVRDDVGYHVEVKGVVDEAAGTISVQSVRRVSEVVNMCAVPKKKK